MHPAVADLRAQLAATDALLFCTPEYAGALPGSFKEPARLDGRGRRAYGMAVGWVNVSGIAAPTGAAGAHASLRAVLTYTGTDIVEPACVRISVARGALGADGLIADPAVREAAAGTLSALAEHGRARRASA